MRSSQREVATPSWWVQHLPAVIKLMEEIQQGKVYSAKLCNHGVVCFYSEQEWEAARTPADRERQRKLFEWVARKAGLLDDPLPPLPSKN